MARWNPEVNDIFLAALEIDRPPERLRYLDQICRGNAELRGHVEQLLAASDRAGDFLETPPTEVSDAVEALATHEPLLMRLGSFIGPYRLLERIGEGGFGTVYLAEQTEPVRRSVALKVVKLGMDTRQVIARFQAERQALAMMDHPHIARVLDAGSTDAGRPYFVMELVRGVPITQYCDDDRVALRERLALFTDVCQAVQHAHQKGIIHRDLKPSNVLVSRHDNRPVVKVIDFGIAKATGVQLTDKTLHTEWRQLIGTPTYMSPEQAGLSDLDIDTRSDIYSLGVLLYELLTGTTPFDAKSLFDSGYDEMRRIIREVDPPRPSTRVSSLVTEKGSAGVSPAGGASIAPVDDSSSRSLDLSPARLGGIPRSLVRSLRGDLDWIVMKCLEKDRARRYENANDLAADLQRYLKHEPVLAGPPNQLYRLRKFARRNRGTVTAATLVAAALLAGIAGTTFSLLHAEQRRTEAEAAQQLAEKREQETQQVSGFQAEMLQNIDLEAMGRGIREHFRDQVRAGLERRYVAEGGERRKRTREEIDAELTVFDELTGAVQSVDVARPVMDEFVLARAAEALETRFADQPLVQAQLHLALGQTYHELSLLDAAEPHLRAALEIRRGHYGLEKAHAEVAECLYNLASLLGDKRNHAEEESMFREALAMWRALHGEDHQMVARTLDALAGTLLRQHRLDEAESLLNQALRLNREHCDEDDPEVIGNLADLASLCWEKKQFQEAEKLHREVLERRRRVLGERNPDVVNTLFNLAQALGSQGKHAEAEELFREALVTSRALYGNEHWVIAKTLSSLGVQLAAQGRRAEAADMCAEALAQQRKLLGDEHPDVRITLSRLAGLREEQGDFEAAVALRREWLAIAERMYPDGHSEAWQRFAAMGKLGAALARQAKALLPADRDRALAKFQEAEPLFTSGYMEMLLAPQGGGLEERRQAAERTIVLFEFWHSVASDRGWGKRAAEWRAKLPELAPDKAGGG